MHCALTRLLLLIFDYSRPRQAVQSNHSGCIWETSEPFKPDVMFWPQYCRSPLRLLFQNQLTTGCSPSFIHGMYTRINKPLVMFYFQRQHYYLRLFWGSFPLTDSAHIPPTTVQLPPFCTVGSLKGSSHQTEHNDLPLAISVFGAKWRWFSITVLTSYNKRISVSLSLNLTGSNKRDNLTFSVFQVDHRLVYAASWRSFSDQLGCDGYFDIACVKWVLKSVLR